MKKIFTILMALSVVALFSYGCDDNTVCNEQISVTGAGSSELYYPCSISGTIGATTMTSGFLGTDEEVTWLAEEVAANGFVVVAMTPLNPLGMVSGWRDAHKAGIEKIKSLNSTHSALRGKIDTSKLQTCGHSKGGGGSLWASSQLGSELKTTIGMAPWQEEFLSLSGIRSATLIQAGALDTLATSLMTMNEYNLLPSSISKAYFMYATADHMSWTNMGLVHDTLSADVVAWMKYYLNGDTSQRSQLSSALGKTINTWEDNSGDDDIGCN